MNVICIPRNLFAGRVHPVAVDLVALFDDLVRLETDLWNRVDARVQQAHGFPLAWMEVMHLVSTTSGCRVLDVAEALFITVGGASKLVDKVEGAGWCRRLPNPNDGRSNLLELTASGRRVLQAARLTFGEALEVYLGAAAPAAELTRLSSTLGRMRRHLIVADRAAGQVS
jgi:DNA-binding MarR family transcriptional regulator